MYKLIYFGFMLAGVSAQAATTPVQGGMVTTLPAGNSLFAPPFIHNDTFVGEITAIAENDLAGDADDTTTLTFDSAAFTASDYQEAQAEPQYPAYYIEVTNAANPDNNGYIFDVQDNGTATLTVYGLLGDQFGLAVGDQITLRKHLTIGELFAGANPAPAAYGDSVNFPNVSGTWDQLFWDGDKWTSDFVSDDSSRQIYPGTGIVAVMGVSVQLTNSGKVRDSVTKVPLYTGALNILGSASPVAIQIGDLGLSSILAPYGDSVGVYTPGTFVLAEQYFTDGVNMTFDFVNNDDGDMISATDAMIVTIGGADTHATLPSAY